LLTLFKMEEEDACAVFPLHTQSEVDELVSLDTGEICSDEFKLIPDRGETEESPETDTADVTGGHDEVDASQPSIEIVYATSTQAELEVLQRRKLHPSTQCASIHRINHRLSEKLENMAKAAKVTPLSRNYMYMALLASAYFGAVYNVLDMTHSMREQHNGSDSNGYMNAIITMVVGGLLSLVTVYTLFMKAGPEDANADKDKTKESSGVVVTHADSEKKISLRVAEPEKKKISLRVAEPVKKPSSRKTHCSSPGNAVAEACCHINKLAPGDHQKCVSLTWEGVTTEYNPKHQKIASSTGSLGCVFDEECHHV